MTDEMQTLRIMLDCYEPPCYSFPYALYLVDEALKRILRRS
jgi:hypothetical protein